MLLITALSLGGCSQISDPSASGFSPTDTGSETTPTGAGISDEAPTDDQGQTQENPPPVLAATDDTASTASTASTHSSGNSADGPAVEWITFELEDVFDETHQVKAAIPAGWVPHEVFDDRWQPAEGAGYGFFTDIGFDQGCDGFCEAKDWEAALNSPDGQLSRTRDEFAVLRDEPIDNGWLLITEGVVVSQRIDVYRWNNDADFFFQCRVELAEEDVRFADEMVEVCLLADPLWLD